MTYLKPEDHEPELLIETIEIAAGLIAWFAAVLIALYLAEDDGLFKWPVLGICIFMWLSLIKLLDADIKRVRAKTRRLEREIRRLEMWERKRDC